MNVNYQKATLFSHPHGSSSVLAILYHEKNGSEYDEDLKIDMSKLGKHAQCQNVLKNRLSPIVQRMK